MCRLFQEEGSKPPPSAVTFKQATVRGCQFGAIPPLFLPAPLNWTFGAVASG